MRAVLDTNILARASRGGTALAAEIVRILTAQPPVLILCPFLLGELATAITGQAEVLDTLAFCFMLAS